ncbi:M23 family metallopeptidase [Hymenobacter sp. BT559]|uniref:M23 family metallopeptidase n=1 Tax=Hymenobacter sp. BT559 TaxID=2795729 RepID=UPI0018ED3A71|nr:M23 family metallopeptidase [Hymenobacter sp. BT559]MBJ6144691.1 M23 family metallopeptidase [Hymenobacter sp. BT559]
MPFSLLTALGTRRAGGLLLALLVVFSSCSTSQTLTTLFQKTTPHEDYARALDRAGLRNAALGQRWQAAADQALRDSLVVALPVLETGFFRADQPTAASYRYQVLAGEQVHVRLSLQPGVAPARVFVDAFALAPGQQPELVKWTTTDTTAGTLDLRYRIEASGQHLLRVQAELLAAGRYTLRLWREPSLSNFPVRGRGDQAVGSFWGAERDGGARRHEGVDIFAPRGTPAVAAAAGVITRVGDTKIGGRVVWLLDAATGQHLYYAHLDRQLVQAGQHVCPGDTLGLVGNTGNARTTVPHLHFGIYKSGRGAVDPWPYLHRADPVPAALPASAGEYLGQWVRLRSAKPGTQFKLTDSRTELLTSSTPLRVLGQQRERLRVELPDGRRGYVATRNVAPAQPLRRLTLPAEVEIQAQPAPVAAALAAWPARTPVVVLGRASGYALLRGPAGQEGWARI